MTHFICTGECKGVSDKPGVCRAEQCSKHSQPLEPCDCEDGKHAGRQDKQDESKSGEQTDAKL